MLFQQHGNDDFGVAHSTPTTYVTKKRRRLVGKCDRRYFCYLQNGTKTKVA